MTYFKVLYTIYYMKFTRLQTIESARYPKRVLVVYGPRRVGKTTLLASYLAKQQDGRVFSTTGEDLHIQEVFQSQLLSKLKDFAEPYTLIAIDEAQQVPNIGIGAKMLIDAFPEKELILTGSSSFDLSAQVGEPLTGRHFTLTLLPIALSEMHASRFELNAALESLLLYGSYPEVLLAPESREKERILTELVSSYLYKDVLALDKIKSPRLLRDIARMIAFQVGSEVSLNEIAVSLQTDVKTVGRYLDLLEKMFVIRRVRGFSRNLRNEITKKARYYFLDNGVRNAVIGQFQPFSQRNDVGALWENFIAMELFKRDTIADTPAQYYFWRTHTGVEVDIVREYNGHIDAYECKWTQPARPPRLWKETYPESTFQVINKDNYLGALLPKTE